MEKEFLVTGEENQSYNSEDEQSQVKKPKKYKQIRPKVTTEWTHDDIIKLIKTVEEQKIIWDISSPPYTLPKTSAWQQIAELIENRTGDECKAKWSNLRVTFKSNLRKSKRQKSGSAASGSIVWKYYNAMIFLDLNETSLTSDSISSMPLELVEDTNLSTPSKSSTSQRGRKIRVLSSSSSSSQSDVFKEMAAKAICTIAEKTKQTDQYDAFGTHIAAELRSLSPSKALFAKKKLARALVDIIDEAQCMVIYKIKLY